MIQKEPVANKKTEQYSKCRGKRSPPENIDKKGKLIENDLLSQVIQCFLKKLIITVSSLVYQRRKVIFLNLNTLRCRDNTGTQGYREQQRPKLPKAPHNLHGLTLLTEATYTALHLGEKLPQNGTVSFIRPPHHLT